MKISIETNVGGRVAPPVLDRLLTRIVAVLEKGTGLKFDVKADGNTVRLAHKASLLRRAGDAMSVVYDASDDGYAVLVLDFKGQIIDEYRAGNHPQSSQDYFPLEEGGLSYEANMVAAQKTALDMAEERGINPRYVSHDSDILAEEREAPHREQLTASLRKKASMTMEEFEEHVKTTVETLIQDAVREGVELTDSGAEALVSQLVKNFIG